jgi:hypothetical protein
MTSPRVLFLSRGFLAMRPVRAEEALPMPATIRTRGQVLLGLKPIAAPDPAQRQKHQADACEQLAPLSGRYAWRAAMDSGGAASALAVAHGPKVSTAIVRQPRARLML